jgi:hypothetical protein
MPEEVTMGRKAVWILGAVLVSAVLATPAAAQVSVHVGIGVPPVAAGVVVGAPPYAVYPGYPPYYYSYPYPYPYSYPFYAYPYRYYRYPPAYYGPAVRYGRPYYRGPVVVHQPPPYGYRNNGGRYYNNDIGAARTYRETPPVRHSTGRR